jgi:transcriptional regulator with XRE-family HTH domain
VSSFSKKLWKARIEKGWSQNELASRIGVTGSAVNQWENARIFPREENLSALRRVLRNFDSDVETEYGLWLRETREAKGWTVGDLSTKSGITKATIYNVESGKTQNANAETRRYLECALGASPDVGHIEIPHEVIDTHKRVFISYRRADSRWQALYLYKMLAEVIPGDHIFMDIDSIPPGVDFVNHLEEWVYKCDILLALIGPGWADVVDPETGNRRLDNPNDFVRIELRQALAREIPVVPVLIDNAAMPYAGRLPEELQALVRRHAEFVQHRTADTDIKRLLGKLGLKE